VPIAEAGVKGKWSSARRRGDAEKEKKVGSREGAKGERGLHALRPTHDRLRPGVVEEKVSGEKSQCSQ
jgi:hypothetical protein